MWWRTAANASSFWGGLWGHCRFWWKCEKCETAKWWLFLFFIDDQGFRSRNAREENWRSGSRLSSHADNRGPSSLLCFCSTHQSHAEPGRQTYQHEIPLWGIQGCFFFHLNQTHTHMFWDFSFCPQVLHHLNEVGDLLCLKFSRKKYSSRPDLSDETDFELDSWYDPWHLHFTVSKLSLSVHAATDP